jgi:hypothetical protein
MTEPLKWDDELEAAVQAIEAKFGNNTQINICSDCEQITRDPARNSMCRSCKISRLQSRYSWLEQALEITGTQLREEIRNA